MTCDKVKYDTWALAREAVAAIGHESGESMHVYKCNDCGGIHIATHGKRRKIKRIPAGPMVTKFTHHNDAPHIRARMRNPPSQRSLPLATYKLLTPEMAIYLKRLIEGKNYLEKQKQLK